MTIFEHILNFLRDAQFRIGELTEQIDELYNIGEIESPKKKHRLRLELMAFMEILYEINWSLEAENFNHVVSYPDEVYVSPWTRQMILDEIEYLRIHCGMSEKPLMTFVPFYTEIVEGDTEAPSAGGTTITGIPGQIVIIGSSGQAEATDADRYAGMRPNETITQYFQGRP